MDYLEQAKAFLTTRGVSLGLSLIKAVIILVIGWQIIKFLNRTFRKFMDKRDFDNSLKPFLESLFKNLLIVLLILSVLSTVGIQMTSFVAVLGAAGLAVGLALQGTLQNFAGGVIILTIKPFQVGDFIDTGSYAGTVKEIQIFQTILAAPDNIRIVIPNGQLSNGSIKNFTAIDTRRCDMVFGIGYGDDLKKAKRILEEMIAADSRVLPEPAPLIAVGELADSSVNILVRPWLNRSDFWPFLCEFQENVKLRFDEEGISIPFPQRDVHLYQESAN